MRRPLEVFDLGFLVADLLLLGEDLVGAYDVEGDEQEDGQGYKPDREPAIPFNEESCVTALKLSKSYDLVVVGLELFSLIFKVLKTGLEVIISFGKFLDSIVDQHKLFDDDFRIYFGLFDIQLCFCADQIFDLWLD